MEEKSIMKDATKRSILRSIHIVFSIPILGYIYSPFEEIPKYAGRVRFVVVPVMLLSGLRMWNGHVLRRLISKRSANQDAAANLTRMKTCTKLLRNVTQCCDAELVRNRFQLGMVRSKLVQVPRQNDVILNHLAVPRCPCVL